MVENKRARRPALNSPFAKPADKEVALILLSLRVSGPKRRRVARAPHEVVVQAAILKEPKVICFHTLLQVFLPRDWQGNRGQNPAKHGQRPTSLPCGGCYSKSAPGPCVRGTSRAEVLVFEMRRGHTFVDGARQLGAHIWSFAVSGLADGEARFLAGYTTITA
jgi:hypothetical protein